MKVPTIRNINIHVLLSEPKIDIDACLKSHNNLKWEVLLFYQMVAELVRPCTNHC